MALDWNKEISLSTILGLFNGNKGPKVGSSAYPTKVTMNLYQGDAQTTDIRKLVATGVALTIAIVLFVKFGVLDQLALLSQKQGELAQQQSIAASLESGAADYDTVKEMYDSYMARYGGDQADAIAILDMIEQQVMPSANVSAIVMSDGTITLTLYNVSLDTVGNLAKQLEGQSMVSNVNVTTATTQNTEGKNTVSTIVITLVSAESEAN